ncbi:MAG: NTP transferase domain-containing protein [Bacteroidota bacterium]|nr:NTP transferase domain-containing protein [Bacteroidota bacterium]
MITGLLIAAGLSKRMGSNKALLSYNNLTFTSCIIIKLLTVCDNVTVVLGHESKIVNEKVLSELKVENIPLEKIKFIVNEDYMNGMFTSLQMGIKSISKADWIMYHFVDQPQIPVSFYSHFEEEIDPNYDWIQPIYGERKGHPVIFNSNICKEIEFALAGKNLKQIIQLGHFKKKYFPCNTSSTIEDIDVAEDYQKLF